MTPRIGSLFSGFGGLDLAVEHVFNAETVWHVEYDAAPSKILAAHWNVPNHGDVTTVDWHQLPAVDILTGGFPCQDVSAAGNRAGLKDGTRSGLWSYMRDAINALKPKVVVIENVRGLLSAQAYRPMESRQDDMGGLGSDGLVLRAAGAVCGELASIGYDSRWCSLRASAIGAPHHRERVFIVAYPADTESVPWSFGDGNGQPAADTSSVRRGQSEGQPSASEPQQPTARSGESILPDTEREHGGAWGSAPGQADGRSIGDEITLLPTPTATDRGDCPSERARRSPDLIAVQHYFPTPTVGNATGTNERRGGVRSKEVLLPGAVLEPHFGKYAPAVERWENVTGMPAPAPTERNSNGKPRLNAAFAEWMMGLPAGWITGVGLTRTEQLKAIGNGVVPQQAAAAIWELVA